MEQAGRMKPTELEEAQRYLSNTKVKAMAEAHVFTMWRRTASHLLSHGLSCHPRASPGWGNLDQGLEGL